MHLYDAFGQRESDWIVAGPIEAPQTFAVGGFTVGLQTCYDLRFPEVTRHLVDAGVDLVLLPSEWVRGPLKEHAWRTLVTARAIENTIYVAAADHAPPIGAGNSMIVDPMGVELVTIGENTDVAVAWISPERIRQVRHTNPALELQAVPGGTALSPSAGVRGEAADQAPAALSALLASERAMNDPMISTMPEITA